MQKIKDPWIAKVNFNNISEPKPPLPHSKWIYFIEKNKDIYTWVEDTKNGKESLANLHKIPASFVEGFKRSYNKRKACAEFNAAKNHYEVILQFNEDLNVIGTTFMRPISKVHLSKLLELSNYLNAVLINYDGKLIKNIE